MRKLHKLSDLTGYYLHVLDDEIGKLKQIFFDDQYWVARYFMAHAGAWLVGKDVLITSGLIAAVDEKNNCIKVNLSKEQIQNSPSISTGEPITYRYEHEYFRYHGLKPYWIDAPLFTPKPLAPTLPNEDLLKSENPYLHSSEDVAGYSIQALDGEIGHVEDVILEEPEWIVRYLEIDTRNWIPGKKALIAPTWIKKVNWKGKTVVVDLFKESIQLAPAYDPSKLISQDYQVALYKHYGKTFDNT